MKEVLLENQSIDYRQVLNHIVLSVQQLNFQELIPVHRYRPGGVVGRRSASGHLRHARLHDVESVWNGDSVQVEDGDNMCW